MSENATEHDDTLPAIQTCYLINKEGVLCAPGTEDVIGIPVIEGADAGLKELKMRLNTMGFMLLGIDEFVTKNPELAIVAKETLARKGVTLDPETVLIAVDSDVNGYVQPTLAQHLTELITEGGVGDGRFPPSLDYFNELKARYTNVLGENDATGIAYLIVMHSAAPIPSNLELAHVLLRLADQVTATQPDTEDN